MAKTKLKSRTEVEELRGENRKLRSENKKLKREIKDLSKRAHFFEEVVDEVIEDAEVRNVCRECGKGSLVSYDLGIIRLTKCTLCEFEKKTKKDLNE